MRLQPEEVKRHLRNRNLWDGGERVEEGGRGGETEGEKVRGRRAEVGVGGGKNRVEELVVGQEN